MGAGGGEDLAGICDRNNERRERDDGGSSFGKMGNNPKCDMCCAYIGTKTSKKITKQNDRFLELEGWRV